MNAFVERYGFERSDLGLHNWRERPFSKWSFCNVSEIVPSAIIYGDQSTVAKDTTPDTAIPDQSIKTRKGDQSLIDFLKDSQTDLFLGWRAGKILYRYAAPHADWTKPHIVFSISKSVTGILAGILEDQGQLDVSRQLEDYFKGEISGGYKDCTVRNLLDMRTSLDFTEEYLNQDGDYARYRRATLWNPSMPGKPTGSLKELLFKLPKGEENHGGPFHYQSPNSDLLGILLERVSGQRYCDLMSSILWKPMAASSNAQMTVDAEGTPRGARGISMTAADLLRIGQLLLRNGKKDGNQILSARWVHDTLTAGDPLAWKEGNFFEFLPGGRYRSQWYQMSEPMDAFFAIGIHGQWLYVDRKFALHFCEAVITGYSTG